MVGWALRIKGHGLSLWTRLDMFVVEQPFPWWGSLLGDIDSLRTMVIHLTLDMRWSNCPMQCYLHSPWAKLKGMLILSLDIFMVKTGRSI